MRGIRLLVLAATHLLVPIASAEPLVTVPPASTTSMPDAIPASALTPPLPALEISPTPYAESALRRAETLFFVSLPFSVLYAAVLSVGVAFAIEGRQLAVDSRVVIPTITLAVLASSFVVWQDLRSRPRDGKPIE